MREDIKSVTVRFYLSDKKQADLYEYISTKAIGYRSISACIISELEAAFDKETDNDKNPVIKEIRRTKQDLLEALSKVDISSFDKGSDNDLPAESEDFPEKLSNVLNMFE